MIEWEETWDYDDEGEGEGMFFTGSLDEVETGDGTFVRRREAEEKIRELQEQLRVAAEHIGAEPPA